MPRKKTKYRALTHVSVRKSTDPTNSAFNEFIDWQPGDLIEVYPIHTDIAGWLEIGAIEEVEGG